MSVNVVSGDNQKVNYFQQMAEPVIVAAVVVVASAFFAGLGGAAIAIAGISLIGVSYLVHKGFQLLEIPHLLSSLFKHLVSFKSASLEEASKSGDALLVKFLLARGANVNKKDFFGMTPLHHAAQNGHIDVLEILLENGADMHVTETTMQWMPLHLAILNRHMDAIKKLIDSGANIHAKSNRFSPLYLAAQVGLFELVKLLIERRANIHEEVYGWSPLQMAAEKGHIDVVEALLEAGADSQKKIDGLTPLNRIVKHGHIVDANQIKKLLDHENNRALIKPLLKQLPLPILNPSSALCNFLMQKQPMQLDAAARSKDVSLLAFLLQDKFGITKHNCKGKTFYMLACQSKNETIKKLFLDHAKKLMKSYQEMLKRPNSNPNIDELREAIRFGGEFYIKDDYDKKLNDYFLPSIFYTQPEPEELESKFSEWRSAHSNLPKYTDVITQDDVKHPVLDPTNSSQVVDRESHEKWLRKNQTSPVTRKPLKIENLVELPHTKRMIDLLARYN